MSASALGGPGLSGSPGPVLGSQACRVPTGLLFEGFSPFAFSAAPSYSVDCFCFKDVSGGFRRFCFKSYSEYVISHLGHLGLCGWGKPARGMLV